MVLVLEYIDNTKQQNSFFFYFYRLKIMPPGTPFFFLKTDHPLIISILDKLKLLCGQSLNIFWGGIPGHAVLVGNEQADNVARGALTADVTEM